MWSSQVVLSLKAVSSLPALTAESSVALLVNDERLPNSSLVCSHLSAECNIWVTRDKESKCFKIIVHPAENRASPARLRG